MLRRFLFAILVIACLFLRSQEACCSDACFAVANSALSIGETLTATALQKTGFKAGDICGAVFTAKGSCCDNTKLRSFAAKLLARIKTTFTAIDSAIQTAPTILKSFPRLLAAFQSKDPAGSSADPTFVESVGGEAEYYKIKAIADFIQAQIDSLSQKITAKTFDSTKCFKTLFESKLNALCLICSGDASSFFDEATKKFKIKKSYCVNLVNDCAGPMDVFSKVSHLFEVIRVVRSALASSTVTTIDKSFSQSRLAIYEECATTPYACNQANFKLTNFCGEFGVVSDIKIVKANQNKLTDVLTVQTEAVANFDTSTKADAIRLTAAVTEKTNQKKDFDPTQPDSIPTKLTAVGTKVAQADTQAIDLLTKITAVKTASTPILSTVNKVAVETARAARRVSLDAFLTQKDAAFSDISAALAKISTSYNAELTITAQIVDSTEIKSNLDSIASIQKKLSARTTTYSDPLKAAKTVFYQAETAAAGSPVTLDIQDKFWSQVDTLSTIDNGIRADFELVRQAASAFVAKKAQKLTADIIAIQISNDKTQSSATKDPVLRDIRAKQDILQQLKDQRTALEQTIASATTAKANLIGPTVVNNLNNTVNNGNLVALAAGRVVAILTETINQIATKLLTGITTTSNSALAPIQTLTANLNQFTYVIPQLVQLDTKKQALDDAITSIQNQITSNQAILDGSKTNMTTLKEQVLMGSQGGQDSLAAIIIKRTELEELKKTQATLTTTINTALAKYKDSLNDASLKLADVQSRKAFLTKSNSTCTSTDYNYNQLYCTQTLPAQLTAINTELTTTQTALNVITTNIDTDTLQSRTQLSTLQTQISQKTTELTALQTALKTAQQQAIYNQLFLQQYQSTIDIKTSYIAAITAQLSQAKSNLLSYTTSLPASTWNTSISQFTPIYEELKIPTGQAQTKATEMSLWVQIPTNGLAIANATLTSINLAINAAIVKLNTTISASKVTSTTLEQNAFLESTKLQTVITQGNTDLAALVTKIETATTEIATLSTSIGVTFAPRLLQTVADDQEFTLSETSGADVNSQYGSGVVVDTDLKSSTTFTDASSNTNPSQQTSTNYSWITLSSAVLMFISAMIMI